MDAQLRARIRQLTWIALIVAYVAAFVGGVYGVATRPSAGVHIVPSGSELVITGFDPGSHVWTEGARVGYIVESINGQTVTGQLVASWTEDSETSINSIGIRPAGSSPGESVMNIDVVQAPTSLIDDAFSLNILGFAFAVISVLLYLRARTNTDTVMFALMGMSAAVSFAIGPASVANQPWGRVAMGGALYVASVTFLAFFISFTRFGVLGSSEWFRKWFPELTIAISAALIVPWVLTAARIVDLFPVLRPLMLIMLALAFLGAIALLAYRLKTAGRQNQEQLRIVLLGTAIGLVPFVWLSVIPLVVTGSEIVVGETSVISFILIPISFGYAISRHSLLGVRRLFHRGAAYAIITAVIIMIYGTVLMALNLLAPDSAALGPIQGALLALMFAGAPMVSSVRRKALRIVDRVLYEGAITQEELVSAISAISSNETDAGEVLARAISFTGQGFEVDYAVVLAYNPADDMAAATVEHRYNAPEAEVLGALTRLSRQSSRGVRRSVLPDSGQAILIGKLRDVGRMPRTIVLGPKTSEEIFTEEDVVLLETVCAVISTALTRIWLLDEVREQSEQLKNIGTEMQNIQEVERQELSSYLHDEPLQKLAYVISRVREMDLPEDLKELLQDVARDLRGTSASLSPEMLRSHGLIRALKWLTEEQQQRGPFRVFLEINGVSESERLPDDVELTIYRSVQEALNNCRKHAKARSVWVKLSNTAQSLELAVEDNGIGLTKTTGEAGEKRPDQGLGIRGLTQRVAALGGTLAILPRSSRGTALMVSIPHAREDDRAAS